MIAPSIRPPILLPPPPGTIERYACMPQSIMTHRRSLHQVQIGPTFVDSFVEASPPVGLNAHTPNVGISWTGDGASFIINPSGTATANSTGPIYAHANPSPSSADCYAQAVCVQGSFGGGNIGPFCRWSSANGGTYYGVFYTPFFGDLILQGRYGGNVHNISSTTIPTGTHTIKITAQGSAIKVFVDTVQKISVIDTNISGAGDSGVYYGGGGSNNGAMTNFESSNL